MVEASNRVWAVVPAAGSGQRMGETIPKQYLKIRNKTLIEHTLDLLVGAAKIDHVLVCTAPDDELWPALNLNFETTLGGDSRAQSVMNGLLAIADRAKPDDWVLVHDAARPCLGLGDLNRFIDQVSYHPVGGIMAMPCKDTLKLAKPGRNEIAETIDRSLVWQAQTPQMFRYQLLREALSQALAKQHVVTDEASAMELAGYSPLLIAGDASNLKVTTPEDLKLAAFLLAP